MLRVNLKRAGLILVVLGIAMSFAGCCAVAEMEAAPKPTCAEEVKTQIAPEAKLVNLNCYFKKFDGMDSLWYEVTLKNISQSEQRFKVQIFLDSGKGVGGLIPRKTAKGLIKPGATAKFAYPVKGQATMPGQVTLYVKTMSK